MKQPAGGVEIGRGRTRFGRSVGILIAFPIVAVGAIVGGPVGLAAPLTIVRCGQVITASVVVANDLVNCGGDALVVGADDVTVDLGGRTIDGVGLGGGVVNHGFDRVSVTNGVIREFDTGVLLADGARGGDVSDLRFVLNQEAAVHVVGVGPGNDIHHNTFEQNALGVGILDGSVGSVVRDNVLADGGGSGVEIVGSDSNVVARNDFGVSSDGGIVLEVASHNVVVDNVVAGVSDSAVSVVAESNGNRIEGNTLLNSDGGIVVEDSVGNLVVANIVAGMSDVGVDLGGVIDTLVMGNDLRGNGEGIALFDSSDNRIEGNDTSDSSGTAIAVEGSSYGNVLVGNRASDGGADGISVVTVDGGGPGNVLDGNEASRNGSTGIAVPVGGQTLRRNTANNNRSGGISAASGTVDGGGNVAIGNAGGQCTGVVCNGAPVPDTDDDPAVVEIDTHPLDPSPVDDARFTFDSDDDLARFECSLDDGPFVACSSPTTYVGLADGEHTFRVRSYSLTDAAAGVPASFTWVVFTAHGIDCGPDVTRIAVADAWIDQNGATSNKGDDQPLKVRSKGPADNFRALVDIPLPARPDGCLIDRATLRLSSDGVPAGRSVHALAAAAAWGESTVTWANQPRSNGQPARSPAGEGIRSWDVTHLVRDMYATGEDHGFIIRDAVEGEDAEYGFSTRESEEPPRLTIRFVPILQAPPDTTAPVIVITAGPTGTTASAVAVFEFESEAGATFECALDGAVFAACVSPALLSGLGDGGHTFLVRATDAAGNVGVPGARTWSVDTTAPGALISAGPTGTTASAVAVFEFGSESGATFECALDGAVFAACGSPVVLTGLGDGEHTFEVRATDAVSNVGVPAVRTWTVDTSEPDPDPDTTAPDTVITAGPAGSVASTVAMFVFVSGEAGVVFECSLDGAGFEACGSPVVLTGLGDGEHTFEVRATDAVGNVGVAAVRTWSVDTTAPVAVITAGPTGTTASTVAVFEFGSEPGATFECALDGAVFASCVSPHALDEIDDGEHTFLVRATDAVGNVGVAAARTWSVDTTAPVTVISAGPTGTTASTVAVFEFGSEPGATFECALDGAVFASCVSPHALDEIDDGEHTFLVRATDAVGNVGVAAARTWSVDTTAPVAVISAGPMGTTASTVAVFEFGSEPGATFECALDGAVFASCLSPVVLTGLGDGEHTFEVRATDAVSNVGVAAARTWTVETSEPDPDPDTTAPDTVITAGPAGSVASTVAIVVFVSGEAGVVFECSLDGAGFEACGSPVVVTGLGDGGHTFEVRATDAVGNVGVAAVRTWSVDTTAPDTVITAGPTGTTASAVAVFEFESEPGATFECALDGAVFAACGSPRVLTGLGDGEHTFEVRATDAVGNVGVAAARTWSVDTTAPVTVITAGPAGSVASSVAVLVFVSGDVGVVFECSLDGAGFEPCGSPLVLTGLGDGGHTFEVRATDAVGNVGAPAVRVWSVDTTAPGTVITAGPTGSVASTEAVLEFESEPGVTFECSLDGAGFEACGSPVVLTGLGDGGHTFEVRATDAVGNVGAPAVRTWTVDTIEPDPDPDPDTTAPDTMITAGPAGSVASTEALFGFESEPGATFECRLDSSDPAGFAPCVSPRSVGDLTDGMHTFEVRATDAAGNVGAPAVRTWSVDTTAPVTVITAGPAGSVASTLAVFEFEAEPGVAYECRIDSSDPAGFAPCVSPRSVADLTDGVHAFEVRATDAVGNVGASAARTWTVDTIAPETTIGSGPPAISANAHATFTFASNDAAAVFECALDGAPFGPCTSPLVASGLVNGAHTLQVRATDPVGNMDPGPASYAWTVQLPVVPQCTTSTIVRTPAADAWLEQNSPTNNKGDDSILKVKSQPSNDNFRTVLRFAAVSVPSGCRLVSVTLRLYADGWVSGRVLAALPTAPTWSERLVTWANQPAAIGQAVTARAASASGYVSWDVTATAAAQIGAGASFVVMDANENTGDGEQSFFSREKGEQPPQLVLRFAPV